MPYRSGVAEIELGRGTTPLPAGLEAEGVSEQRCVVKVDDVGYHIEALESLSIEMTWDGGEPVIGPVYSARMVDAFGPLRTPGSELEPWHAEEFLAHIDRDAELVRQ